MAENITIKSHEIVGIKKVCPYETEIVLERHKVMRRRQTKTELGVITDEESSVHKTYRQIDPLTPITHEVHYLGATIHQSKDSIIHPDTEVGIQIWFGAASAVGRPSNSKALLFNDQLYYFLSWTDILGKGHGRENNPSRSRNKTLINYLQIVENERHHELILEQIRKLKLV